MTTPLHALPRLTAFSATAAAGILVGLSFWPGQTVAPGFTPTELRMIGLCVIAVGLWASTVVPEHLTALGFFFGAMVLAVAPAPVVFSGFHSTALWLVLSGMLIGTAIKNTGLAARFAEALSERLGYSYRRNVCGLVLLAVGLAFVMPSSVGRILILLPIVLALADRLGLQPGRKGRTGLIAAVGFGTVLPAFSILPANVPNLILSGLAETLYAAPPTYGTYLLLHFPVMGLGKALCLILLILWMFPDKVAAPRAGGSEEAAGQAGSSRGAMTRDETVLLVILSVTLALWATDSLHHISPAWIGLGSALVCFLPRVAVLRPGDFSSVNLASLLYIAGVIALGAMVADSGLGALLGRGLVDAANIVPGEPVRSFLVLATSGALSGLALAAPGVPGVFTPLAQDLAAASGLPLATILMTIVTAFSTVILPYQSPPIVIAILQGGMSMADGARLTLAMAGISVILLFPATAAWWRVLGVL